ncbi:L,D-transpeptidase family protein [Chitinophagaceae bacterium MMS25-I14]
MIKKWLLRLSFLVLPALVSTVARAQDDVQTFRNFQFSFNRVSQAWTKCNDSLRKMFEAVHLAYPPKDIYIRDFKAQNEMELWARDSSSSEYKLVKLYRVCALSGILGPKRTEGDRQVPEGLYFIEDFNPKSDFYLSLLVSYPNYSDLILGDKQKPGGDVYIHGGCVTIGCLPMTDPVIQEIYVLCLNAKMSGENYIPVHIFPTRFDRRGLNFLGRQYATDTTKQRFWVNLKTGYDYFERTHKLLPVMYSPDGKYIF